MSIEKLSAPVGTALDRFIARRQEEFPHASGELSQLLRDIALASKIINREINRAGLVDIGGAAGQENVQGEDQQKLDVVADIRFIRALRYGGETCAILSEEVEKPILTDSPDGKYIVAIDPLDGSSNIDVNVSIGTIFSIFRRVTPIGKPLSDDNFLQKGDNQVAAGYVLYGSSTMMVYTTGHGVNGFTLEPSLGEYFLSHPDIQMPAKGKFYSINDSFRDELTPKVENFINECRTNGLSARYIGSLVGDFHRNMLKGGIYMYPATSKNPKGKLRLMYECSALAFLAEQAGGIATDGKGRIMEVEPTSVHERVPFFVGSKELMKDFS
jgi:fructose-1,6-bisphosphatase I